MQKGAGFVGEDVNTPALLDRRADDPQSGAVAAGGQGAGVAVSQNANGSCRGISAGRGEGISQRQQRRAECAHSLAGLNVFLVHRVGLVEDFFLNLAEHGAGGQQAGKESLHAVDGPEKIDRGGTGSRQPGANLVELGGKLPRRGGFGAQCAQGDAVGGRDADGRRATHHHGDDDLGNLFIGGGENVALLQGEPGLIDETDTFRGPGKCGDHGIPV